MAWYRAGTVSVTNGSAIINGVGVDFIANSQAGDAFQGPDGRSTEILTVVSSTQIILASNYLGATAAGQAYAIQPTSSFARDLALSAANLLNTFGAVRDGIGVGLIPAGTLAAPGIRFSADQDTGFYRPGENQLGLVTGGAARLFAGADGNIAIGATSARARLGIVPSTNPSSFVGNLQLELCESSNNGAYGLRLGYVLTGSTYQSVVNSVAGGGSADLLLNPTGGNVGIGTTAPAFRIDVAATGSVGAVIDVARMYAQAGGTATSRLLFGSAANTVSAAIGAQTLSGSDGALLLYTNSSAGLVERARLDNVGNLLVGTNTGSFHRIIKTAAEGAIMLGVGNPTDETMYVVYGAKRTWNNAATALYLGANTSTNRSANVAGTINASGADYAEYMTKAAGCGTIAKGDVCGVDEDGRLTKTWSAAHSFVVKSTNPNLVGGDSWALPLGARPEPAISTLPAYNGPPEPVAPMAPVAPLALSDPAPGEPVRSDDEDDMAFIQRMAAYLVESAAWAAAMSTYQDQSTTYQAAIAAYEIEVAAYAVDLTAYHVAGTAYDAEIIAANAADEAAQAQYEIDLAAFEAALETSRQSVDRIAFSGQVPINLTGEFAVGDYVIAVANGGGIKAISVPAGDVTFDQYRNRVGKIWAIREGRAWIDVQHG